MYLYHKYLSWIVLSNDIYGKATDAISALITCCKYFGNRNIECAHSTYNISTNYLSGIGVLVDGFSKSLLNGRSTPTQDKKPDRSFMILPSDKHRKSPKQYFKAATNASKGGGKQSRAKIANLPPKGQYLSSHQT